MGTSGDREKRAFGVSQEKEKLISSRRGTSGDRERKVFGAVQEKVFDAKLIPSRKGTSEDRERKVFNDFQERVKRTVFLDNLTPRATMAIIKTALGQFGEVLSVTLIPNYLELRDIPQCALVEMKNPTQAAGVVFEITNAPFMISGMPRAVRALLAREEMFSARPRDPDRKMVAAWLDPSDPEFEVVKEWKHLLRKHAVEHAALLKYQLGEEEKLAKEQEERLKAVFCKYTTMECLFEEGTIQRLAKRYNFRIEEDESC